MRHVQGTPRVIRALQGVRVKSITSGYFSAGCLDHEGKPFSWGNGLYWQLAHGEAQHEFVPRRVRG